MPQVSKRKMDKEVEVEMFRQFWLSLGKLRDVRHISSFYSDLLTETEKIMLAKRFTVAVLLLRGKHPVEIRDTLRVTFTTIGSVGSWLKNAKPETATVLQAIVKEGNWRALLTRIDSLLDDLPPRYGTNWSREYGERRARRRERHALTKLR